MMMDRCPRTGLTFCDLIDEAHANGTSLLHLLRRLETLGCDDGCFAYVRRAYRTGQTCFTVPVAESDEPPADATDTRAERPRMHG